MELDAIHVFVKVVEVGSFSGAAQLLKMPKTTVSAKVAALERRLGVTLIQRTTRKLHVTEAGRTYFQHAAAAVKEIEKGESELLASQEIPRGLLKITAPGDLGHTFLPAMVSLYGKRYPETEVELIVTNRLVDLVAEGVDLAIRAGRLSDSTLVARRFFEPRAKLYASPGYIKKFGAPEHPRELGKHPFIAFARHHQQALELTDGKNVLPLTIQARYRADDFETVKAFLLQKEGIGVIPEFIALNEIRAKDLVQVLPKWHLKQEGQFSFVYPGQKYASPKIKAFIEVANEVIREAGCV
jgi:DNA-binding transcriptional LysR family regulator